MAAAARNFAIPMAIICIAASPVRAQPPANTQDQQIVLLAVSINGRDQGISQFVRRNGQLYVPADTLKSWNLAQNPPASLTVDGRPFVALSGLAGVKVTLNEAQQSVALDISAGVFRANVLQANAAPPPLSPGAFAAFLNYDLNGQLQDGVPSLGAFALAGVSDKWGVLTSSMTSQESTAGGASNNLVRLDTTFIHDDRDDMTRLTVGDAITRATDWTRPVRFGGIQYGTDFGLQPSFIAFPTPSFAGQATLPSTLQAYVNNAVRYTNNVPQGPFDVQQVPVVTGAGDVRFVVTDTLGIQRSVTVPYYVSPDILKAGLQDYSIELGAVRGNYSETSFSYGAPLASGTYRRGLTDNLTAQLHAEADSDVRQGGAGLTWVVSKVGEFSFDGAGSDGIHGDGLLGQAAFSRITPDWSLSVSYQATTKNFYQVGAELPAQQILTQAQAFGSVNLDKYGSLSASYTQLRTGDGIRTDVAQITYDLPVFDLAYLNLFALHDTATGTPASFSVGFQITIPLGQRESATAGLSSTNGHLDPRAELRRDPPFGTGFGYDAIVSPDEFNRADGQLTWRNDVNTLTGEVSDTQTGIAGRIETSGAIGYAGGTPFAARELGDAFGVVDVSGYPNVRVYQENQLVGKTDDDGRLAVPELLPYQRNTIRIETADLPFDAEIGQETQILVPAQNGAAVASFDVHGLHGATAKLLGPDGAPLASGTSVAIDAKADAAFVGQDGEVFITNARTGAVLRAQWNGQPCEVPLGPVPQGRDLPNLGPITCEPMEAR